MIIPKHMFVLNRAEIGYAPLDNSAPLRIVQEHNSFFATPHLRIMSPSPPKLSVHEDAPRLVLNVPNTQVIHVVGELDPTTFEEVPAEQL